MANCFHFAQSKLGGSLILPGNFARLLERYTPSPHGAGGFGNAWLLCRELIFDQLRPTDKPSRFNCSFVLPTLSDAKIYRAANDGLGLQVLHEVEILNLNSKSHTGALSFLDMTDGLVFLATERQCAGHYWSGDPGDPDKGYEMITESALRVLQVIE